MTVITGQPELTKEQIIEAIRPVNDPEIGRSLVELKMIPDIEITGRDVLVHVELTTPACPLKGKIADDVRAALVEHDPGDRRCHLQVHLPRPLQRRRAQRRPADQGGEKRDRGRIRQGRRRQIDRRRQSRRGRSRRWAPRLVCWMRMSTGQAFR